MTYWHMQFFQERPDGEEKRLLEKKALIGIGESNDKQIEQFKDKMNIGDIVLVRRGAIVHALVEVIGEVKEIPTDYYEDEYRLDWFKYRRKVKVLDWADKHMDKFPQLQGNLTRLVNKKTRSYQYIHNWYTKIIQNEYKKEELIKGSYKLKELYINKFKMFKKLQINFTDNDKTPLPLIIIAGKNGAGKTTLLEYMHSYNRTPNDYIEIFQTDNELDINIFKIIEGMKGIKSKKDEYKNHVLYLPVEINKIDNVEDAIVNYHINIGVAKDLRPSEIITELKKFMDDIFDEDFNLSFSISKIDIQTRQVFFKNHNGIEIAINELSTGEKTLLSKVLYLYFKGVKNKIILIDEPELSLHPAWQNKVLKLYENFAKENNCQIIIATHSPHIIGSAKNEYIRILTEDGVINDVLAYGRDIEWVLEEVMGASCTREPTIAKKIKECQELLNNDRYDETEVCIDNLENIIGSNDSEVLKLRNDLFFEREDFEEDS